MKLKTLLVSATVAVLATINLPLSASARSKESASASPSASVSPVATATTATKAIPFHGMISSVDITAKTFTVAGKGKSHVFKITDKTVLIKGGNPATMKDVVTNEEARGAYWKMPDGTLEAKSVKLGSLTAQEKAARKERREAKKQKEAATPSASASAKP